MRQAAISNIAWPAEADAEALDLVVALGFDGIELAPAKALRGWPGDSSAAPRVRAALEASGLPVVSLQAITYGVEGIGLFGDAEARARLFDHLVRVARTAGMLRARACVFGAPRLRDPGNLPFPAAFEQAAHFLRRVAPIFEAEGASLAFEANAAVYGCRFVTNTQEAIDLVRAVDHPGITVQIDTGTIFINGEDPSVVAAAAPLAGHFHVSEPHLSPLGSTGADHRPIATALQAADYHGWISAEMGVTADWRFSIRQASEVLQNIYGWVPRQARSGPPVQLPSD